MRDNDKGIIEFLKMELTRRKDLNPLYSLRGFANFLEVSPTTLSQVISCQRKLGKKTRQKIIKKLDLETKISLAKSFSYQKIEIQNYQIASKWHYDAVLELMKFNDFKMDPQWISKSLDISIKSVTSAINSLIEIGAIYQTEQGTWQERSSGHTTHISKESNIEARKNYQLSLLSESLESVENLPLSVRNHTSMMVSIRQEQFDEATQLIANFRREFAKKIDTTNNPENIYQLCLGFFPLTKNFLKKEA